MTTLRFFTIIRLEGYLCIPLIIFVFEELLSFIGLAEYDVLITLLLIYGIFFLLCIFKRRLLVLDFWIIYILITMFFAISYLLYPEYDYFYTRTDYGVWHYILRPDNGIMIYLFLRLVDDPKEILKTVKFSGWFMYFYYGLLIASALTRGYWVDTSNYGYEIHMSYNLSLGYNILLFPLAYLYSALEEKNIFDEVSFATLVHWDMWEGNVFVDGDHVSGIIDWERAMWGEAFMDDRFRKHNRNKDFLEGFGKTDFTETELKRLRWYDIILYLTMMVEVFYREFEDKGQYYWSKEQLLGVI